MRTINDAAISIFQKKHSYRNTKSDKALCTIAYSLITPFAAVRADEEYALTGRLFSTDRLGAKILALLWTDQVAPPYAANLSAMVDAPEGLVEQALDLFQREGYLRFPCQQGPCFFNKEFLNAVEDDRPFLDVMSERQMSVFELNTLQALVGEDDREDGPIPGTGGDQAGGLASFPPERLLEEVRKDLGGSPRTPFSKAMNRLTKGLTREEESVLYLLLGQFARYFLRPLSCMDLRSGAWALAVRQQVGTLIRKGLVESVVEYDEKGDRARKGLFRISPRCAEVFRGRETVIDYSQLAETGSFLTQDEIQRKELYFPEEDLEAMGRLRKALRPGHYERIVSSLAAKGLRTSISAILAGPPGTGKTELARQVALETGRSLFIVDAAKLYGALWGDSEKNFRKLFQTYRYVCAVTRNAPILFMDEAEGILAGSKEKAASFLEDGGKMDQLLEQVEQKLETVPKAGVYLAEVPRMIALLKDYIQKDYTEVPKSTLIMIVAALLYLVNPKDIIPDKYIGVGLIDDAAVVAACIALTKKELDAYDAWKEAKPTA